MKKILAVDDEADLLEITEQFLKMRGYEPVTASGGHAAFDLWKKDDFDLVITDMRMPEGSGLDLIQAIRNTGSQVPVIIVTGFSHDIEEISPFKPFIIMTKPISLSDLDANIKAALG